MEVEVLSGSEDTFEEYEDSVPGAPDAKKTKMAFQTKDPWSPMAVPDCPLIPLDEVQEEEEDQEEEDQEEEEKMYESPWSDDGVPHYSTATMDLNDLAAVQKELDESPPDSNFHKLIKRRPASSMAPPSTKKARSNSDEDEVQIDEGAVHDELGEDPEEAPNRTAKVQTTKRNHLGELERIHGYEEAYNLKRKNK